MAFAGGSSSMLVLNDPAVQLSGDAATAAPVASLSAFASTNDLVVKVGPCVSHGTIMRLCPRVGCSCRVHSRNPQTSAARSWYLQILSHGAQPQVVRRVMWELILLLFCLSGAVGANGVSHSADVRRHSEGCAAISAVGCGEGTYPSVYLSEDPNVAATQSP